MENERYGEIRSAVIAFECRSYAKDTLRDLKKIVENEGASCSTDELLSDLIKAIEGKLTDGDNEIKVVIEEED